MVDGRVRTLSSATVIRANPPTNKSAGRDVGERLATAARVGDGVSVGASVGGIVCVVLEESAAGVVDVRAGVPPHAATAMVAVIAHIPKVNRPATILGTSCRHRCYGDVAGRA